MDYGQLDESDVDLVMALAGCSLAKTSKKDNWVDKAGGLPEYICEIARAVKRSGHDTSSAIAIAVGRAKAWAAGRGKVTAATRAKAAKAVAEWEAKKAAASNTDTEGAIALAAKDSPAKPYGDVNYADPGYKEDKKKRYPINSADHVRAAWSYINMPKNHTEYTPEQVASIKSKIRGAAKKLGVEIAASAQKGGLWSGPKDSNVLVLCGMPFSMDLARSAYEQKLQLERAEKRKTNGTYEESNYEWVKEVWTDALIVSSEIPSGQLYRVPIEFDGSNFEFGEKEPVRVVYVTEDEGDDLDKLIHDHMVSEGILEMADVQLTRKVRTSEGVKKYDAPIGTPIIRDASGKLVAKISQKATGPDSHEKRQSALAAWKDRRKSAGDEKKEVPAEKPKPKYGIERNESRKPAPGADEFWAKKKAEGAAPPLSEKTAVKGAKVTVNGKEKTIKSVIQTENHSAVLFTDGTTAPIPKK